MLIGLALVSLAMPATAVERWGPTWSEVSGVLYHRTTINRTPAIIKRIDGVDKTQKPIKAEPGMREIVVQSPTRKGFRGSDETMHLNLEPCKRYYINAQFESGTGPRWEPVISEVETIAGCKLPAQAKAG
jgi:hypothetical protein